MIRYLVLCFVAVGLLGRDAAYAQEQSQLEYFPLQVGDFWQYKVELFRFSSTYFDTTLYGSISVVKDTVMKNGMTYAVVQNHNMAQMYLPMIFNNYAGNDWDEYLRIDTSNACVLGYGDSIDVLYDSLSASPGDQFYGTPGPSGYRYVEFDCLQEDTSSIPGGALRSVKDFSIWTLTVEAGGDYNLSYASGIGYLEGSYSANDMAELSWNDTLLYARINGVEYGKLVGIDARRENPTDYRLSQNYPNPFNPSTTIEYALPASGVVTLKVYNVLGEIVAILADGFETAGNHFANLNARGLASGIYFYRLNAGSYVETRKMVLLK